MSIGSGSVSAIGAASGVLDVSTGNASAGPAGAMSLRTGDSGTHNGASITIAAGAALNESRSDSVGGGISITSGGASGEAARTGAITVSSASSSSSSFMASSGDVKFASGASDAIAGTTGGVNISTGDSNSGRAGVLRVHAGHSGGANALGAPVHIHGGNTTGDRSA